MSRRWKALRKPCPEGWRPDPGDFVFIDHGIVAYAQVVLVNKGFVLLRLEYGRKRWMRPYLIRECRPYFKPPADRSAPGANHAEMQGKQEGQASPAKAP